MLVYVVPFRVYPRQSVVSVIVDTVVSPQLNFITTISKLLFTDVSKEVPATAGSKSEVPLNQPVVYMLPALSKTEERLTSISSPPICLTHTKSPAGFSFIKNISVEPLEVMDAPGVPGLKSALPQK
ncbi:hypothetical protein D9M68_860830 [compost metagenome]